MVTFLGQLAIFGNVWWLPRLTHIPKKGVCDIEIEYTTKKLNTCRYIPFGNLTSLWKSPFLIGKPSINGISVPVTLW